MWSRGRPGKGLLVVEHVMNGDYPAAAVKRLSRTGLERLVTKLVQSTVSKGKRKPKWWPSKVVFKGTIDLGIEDELTLQQLVVNCSQFFKKAKWLPATSVKMVDYRGFWCENDENRGVKRKRHDIMGGAPKKRFRPLVEVPVVAREPYVPLQDVLKVPTPVPPEPPTKDQFMEYFALGGGEGRIREAAPPQPSPASWSKFNHCTNIPFSSEVGMIMAARENHKMPEELKLRRLERTEWYTGKAAVPPRLAEVEYELTSSIREPPHSHRYLPPKRQQHQKRWSLHRIDFLVQFCRPMSVTVEKLDDKIVAEIEQRQKQQRKELVVVIESSLPSTSSPTPPPTTTTTTTSPDMCSAPMIKLLPRTSARQQKHV